MNLAEKIGFVVFFVLILWKESPLLWGRYKYCQMTEEDQFVAFRLIKMQKCWWSYFWNVYELITMQADKMKSSYSLALLVKLLIKPFNESVSR